MGARLRFKVLSVGGLLAAGATGLAVACGGDDGSGPGGCIGADCDGGASSETSTTDSPSGTDGNTPPSDGGSDADADADSSVVMNCGDGGAPGALDETFGDGGLVWLKYTSAQAHAVVIQPDGKVLVGGSTQGSSGYFAIARLLPNGSLDPSFGTAGLVEVKAANLNPTISALALQADGKIVAAGFTRFTGKTFDYAVLRYGPAGGLDPSFGDGGVALTSFGALIDAYGSSVAIQADGRILVGGHADSTDADYAVARYNANGTLDSTFGTAGIAKIDVRGTNDGPGLVALGGAGNILVGGSSVDPNDTNRSDISGLRVGSAGTLDPTFAAGGKFVSSSGGAGTQAFGVLVDPSGRMLLAGMSKNGVVPDDFAVVRLGTTGTPDATWGDAGLVTTDFSGRVDVASAVLHQGDGRIVAVGSSDVPGGAADTMGIALMRYLSNGGADVSFGAGGKTLTPPPAANTRLGASAAALGECSVVVIGTWGYNVNGPSADTAFGIARYWR